MDENKIKIKKDLFRRIRTLKGNSKNRGITLIALVVTVIILLILAGISIASLTGKGIFEKAKLAKEKQENAQVEEDETLGSYENNIETYLNNNRDKITLTQEQYNDLLITTINISSPNTTGWVKISEYPDGFDYNNTIIISGELSESNNKIILPFNVDSSYYVQLIKRSDGIYMCVGNTAYTNLTGKLYLKKSN